MRRIEHLEVTRRGAAVLTVSLAPLDFADTAIGAVDPADAVTFGSDEMVVTALLSRFARSGASGPISQVAVNVFFTSHEPRGHVSPVSSASVDHTQLAVYAQTSS